jgi:hypothetical protein
MSIFSDILTETHEAGWHELDYLSARPERDQTAYSVIPGLLDAITFCPPSEPRSPLFAEVLDEQDTCVRVWLRAWAEARDITLRSFSATWMITKWRTVQYGDDGAAWHPRIMPSPSALPSFRPSPCIRYAPPACV